jgi:hypothetical protein
LVTGFTATAHGFVPEVMVAVTDCLKPGITRLDAAEAALVPELLVAVTVKVYWVPLANPVTVMLVHGAVQVPVRFDGLLVAV